MREKVTEEKVMEEKVTEKVMEKMRLEEEVIKKCEVSVTPVLKQLYH